LAAKAKIYMLPLKDTVQLVTATRSIIHKKDPTTHKTRPMQECLISP